jgi:HEAT repeat protein
MILTDRKSNLPNQLTPATLYQYIFDLKSDDIIRREEARHQLVQLGDTAVDYLEKFLHSKEDLLRWEITKTLAGIATPAAVPLLLEASEDKLSSIRWIAVEGLLRVGDSSIAPLLTRLIDNSGSVFLLESAHHFFYILYKIRQKSDFKVLLKALETSKEIVPVLAEKMLNDLDNF